MEVPLLVVGAALGAAFGELLKFAMEARASCVNFKDTLARLIETLLSLDPVIQEMEQQNRQLKRPEEALKKLINIMGDGKQLVLECSEINKINVVAKARHEKKLQELITSLQAFITVDMQVQAARDIKDILLGVKRILSRKVEKCPCLKAEEDATSHSISTSLLQDVNESEQELELWLSWIENKISNSSLSAESSTNGIDANEVTHEKKEFIFRGFLSVTVVSAENLPAMDYLNGKSDPFVVLTLKKAKSEVQITYETKVVKNCLDPVWNQTFVFDVEDGLNDELVVQVWDKHTTRKDDFMGRCTLPLRKVIHEEEYERSFKLLGVELGYLKLHLKWMLQPIDCDSNFLQSLSTSDLKLKPVGTLKVKLLQAKELTNTHMIRKPDPFVVLYMQASVGKVKESETINNDLNPIWNEHFKFDIKDVSTENLIVEVYDSKHSKSSKLIGCAEIRLSGLQPGKVKYVWSKLVPLENQRDNKIRGQVHMELLYCSFGMEKSLTNAFDPNCSMVFEGSANGTEADGSENAVTQRENEVTIRGFFSATVISHEDLPALDLMRTSSGASFFLTLRKAKSKEEIRHQTKVMNPSLGPAWDCTFVFDVEDGLNDMVILEVWDKVTSGKKLVRCILSLTKVILEGEYIKSFELVGLKSGSLKLQLKWNPK